MKNIPLQFFKIDQLTGRYVSILLMTFLLSACGEDIVSTNSVGSSGNGASISGFNFSSDEISELSETDGVSFELGLQVYADNCASCHQPIDRTNKPYRSLQEIESSIQYIPAMTHIVLNTVELQSLTLALNPSSEPSEPDPVDTEVPVDIEVPVNPETLYSVVVRLTNDEYLATLGNMLSLSDKAQDELEEVAELAQEAPVGGLVSTAGGQDLSQIAFNQLLAVVNDAVDLQLNFRQGSDADINNFASRVACPSNVSNSINDCIRYIGEQYIETGYRGYADKDDIAALDSLLKQLDAVLKENATAQDTAFSIALKKYVAMVQFISLSPKFSSHIERGIVDGNNTEYRQLTDREIANKLAYFVTGSPPDAELLSLTSNNNLSVPEIRREQAARLVKDKRYVTGIEDIVADWLLLDVERTTPEAIEETREFLNAWISERRPFADLYTALVTVENGDNANSTIVSEEPFGILGLEAVLASNTNESVPSFINRGEFVTAELLCANLPVDLPDSALDVGTDVHTELEIFEIHGTHECATCHVVFDNYGAALHRFNPSAGLYTDTNILGSDFELYPIGDIVGRVTDPGDLGNILGASRQAHSCFAELWYRHATRRDMNESDDSVDAQIVSNIVNQWMVSDSSVQALLEIISSDETFDKLYY